MERWRSSESCSKLSITTRSETKLFGSGVQHKVCSKKGLKSITLCRKLADFLLKRSALGNFTQILNSFNALMQANWENLDNLSDPRFEMNYSCETINSKALYRNTIRESKHLSRIEYLFIVFMQMGTKYFQNELGIIERMVLCRIIRSFENDDRMNIGCWPSLKIERIPMTNVFRCWRRDETLQ